VPSSRSCFRIDEAFSRATRHRAARALAVAALASGCATAALPGGSTAATPNGSGPVDVLYAGSLVDLMQNSIGPRFDAATGYAFTGFSAGSTALATEIKGETQQGDVFVSAGAQADASLEGAANGDWVSWYANFGKTQLLLGYNPNSSFAQDLQTMPWYKVITMPGFLLGRTDPAIDPKGVLTVNALQKAAQVYHDPSLLSLTQSTANVFPEQTMVGRLEAGQLDAGFFYGAEAKAAGFPTVSLGKVKLYSPYTVSILNRAPDAAGAQAFVSYLLGHQSESTMRADGISVRKHPQLVGKRSAVPAPLRKLFRVTKAHKKAHGHKSRK
jgi:molybdate transport system substrate-binding protein